ncbi:MAG TPA: hypothetical protein VNM14_04000 [Planctomycetota bacterium]|jgi:hypothetical protein|nr:hypothetical protein [Planctomycetota bacterium]
MRALWLGIGGLLLWQQGRLPVPDAASQQRAEKEIRSVYAKEFAPKDRESRRLLAQKLLSEGTDTKDPNSRFMLFSLSRDLGADALDFSTAFAAIDKLEAGYDMVKPPLTGATFTTNLDALKAAFLNKVRSAPLSPEDAGVVLDMYIGLAQNALAARRFDDAVTWTDLAAKGAKDPSLVARANEVGKRTRETKKEEEDVEKAQAALKSNPADPQANLTLGRYYVFAKNDLDNGFGLLSLVPDPALQDAARKEIAKPMTPEAQAELGEAWCALAKKEKDVFHRKRYEGRGRYWLESALAGSTGMAKTKIDKKLEEIDQANASGPIVDLLKLIDPKKDSVRGAWQFIGPVLSGPVADAQCQIQIPYIPPEEYDVKMVVERMGGQNEVHLGLAVGDVQFEIILGGDGNCPCSGLQLIDGKGIGLNEATFQGALFSKGKTCNVLASVRRTKILVLVDGKKVVDWKASYRRLSIDTASWGVPNKKAMFLASWSNHHISKLTLVPITGQGQRLR